MKFQLVVEDQAKRIKLIPETAAERLLLGSVVTGAKGAKLAVEWDGISGGHKARSVELSL